MGFGFHIENFGCRAARADGEAIGARLLSSGHCAEAPSDADVVVVNTCTVTAEADREARAFIRRATRINPTAKIVVTGCYAQRAPAELAVMNGVVAVVGNSHKALVPEIVSGVLKDLKTSGQPSISYQGTTSVVPQESPRKIGALAPEGGYSDSSVDFATTRPATDSLVTIGSLLAGPASIFADDNFAHSFIEEAQLVPGTQTRPNLKIQEGCGNRCTFCVIPFTRGPSKSLPHAAVLKQVEGFIAAGGNELVLSGINLGRWGRELPERNSLPALVRHILTRTALPRLRLSSIEPMDWTDELIGLMAEFAGPHAHEPRLARHAHLPLQSGSDAVLRRMYRRYRPWHYSEKVAALVRAAGPELTLGADVMVGFPGETDAEFEETVAFIRALPFGYLHLFPFSPRPGTRGWELHAATPVAPAVVLERMNTLRELAREKSLAHRVKMIGQELPAITLHTPAALVACGRTEALTDNFLPVELEGSHAANQLLCIKVTGLTPEGALAARPARLAESTPDLTENNRPELLLTP
jgi:threonylcarbamoyladenosine tRNA methylthiotransferase MtaB